MSAENRLGIDLTTFRQGPKLGASYQVSRWDETIGVTDDDHEDLIAQLDETVCSVMADAGIPVHPADDDRGDGPFVPDGTSIRLESKR